METNKELNNAWDFVENTGKSIFLTGKAGTGKTTFLKRLAAESRKRMIVVAPTGVAAINAGGVTIHSFFQLPLSPYVPNSVSKNRYDFGKEKRKILRTLDILVIDEISMVRSDLLDAIDSVLRRFRDHGRPFGGVQLLMIGDLQQLTPVVTPEDERILAPFYDTPYFFGSHALQLTDYVTIELKKVYRQQDTAFIDILNHIRDGKLLPQDLTTLNCRYIPDFTPKPEDGYIRLTTHNNIADNHNQKELEKLSTQPFTYAAEIQGTFPEYSYPAPQSLELKVGAQVMFLKNDPSPDHRYYNGRIGRIVYLDDDTIRVLCSGDSEPIEVMPQDWENAKYVLNEKTKEIETDIQGVFRQFPLRLAWAITIHKSQGLTFDRAIIDAQLSFASGQVYVALSRCKSLSGLVLSSPIHERNIICDPRVTSYISNQEEITAQSVSVLPRLKEEYYRFLLIELFDFSDIANSEEALCRVMIEFFSKNSPLLVTAHKEAMAEIGTKVVDVAAKWTAVISRMVHDSLLADDFQERIRRSADYFHDAISAVLDPVLSKTAGMKVTSKEAARRLETTFVELRQIYIAKKLLLRDIADDGFSVTKYLNSKQLAILDSFGDGARKSKSARKTKKEPAPKKPKEPKESTFDITLRLYREGKDIAAIVSERGLSSQTVIKHLARFVESGDLPVADFITSDTQAIVNEAIESAGSDATLSTIKELCPSKITYGDILFVIAERARKGLTQ